MLSLVPSSEFGAAGCVRAGIACVSVDFVGFWVVRFSLLVGWTVRACGYVRFLLWLFVGFARNVLRRLTRGWVDCFG